MGEVRSEDNLIAAVCSWMSEKRKAKGPYVEVYLLLVAIYKYRTVLKRDVMFYATPKSFL